MYHPRTQDAAQEYAESQVKQRLDGYEYFTRARIQKAMDKCVKALSNIIKIQYPDSKQLWDYAYWQSIKSGMQMQVRQILMQAHHELDDIYERSLVNSYLISAVGLAYTVHSTTPPTVQGKVKITQKDIDDMLTGDHLGSNWRDRLTHLFDNYERKVMEQLGQSAVVNDFQGDVIKRIQRIFTSQSLSNTKEAAVDVYDLATVAEIKRVSATLPPDIEPGSEEWKKAIGEQLHAEIPPYLTIDNPTWEALIADLRASQGWDKYRIKAKYMVVESMFQEEKNIAVMAGRYDAAKQNKHGIKDMEWVAVIDDKTSDDCKANNGKTYRQILEQKGKKATILPAHYNCRCQYIPRIEKWDSLAKDNHYDSQGNPFIEVGELKDFMRY